MIERHKTEERQGSDQATGSTSGSVRSSTGGRMLLSQLAEAPDGDTEAHAMR